MRNHKTTILITAITLMLAGHVAAFFALDVQESAIGVPGWQSLPARVGEWNMMSEEPIELAVLAYLRPDDYVVRTYRGPDNTTSLSIFLAYFKSLQNSYGPHSPRVCLPAAGWMTRSSRIVRHAVAGSEQQIPVNEYVMERNDQQILVLYWYQNARRAWAEEFQAKLHLLPDLLRYRRSDVTLIRIVIPTSKDAVQASLKQGDEFAEALFPLLVDRLAAIR